MLQRFTHVDQQRTVGLHGVRFADRDFGDSCFGCCNTLGKRLRSTAHGPASVAVGRCLEDRV